MKFLRMLVIAIVAIVALVLIIAIFLPSQVSVERSTVINASDSTVFANLSSYLSRAQWDPWLKLEPSAKFTLSGPETGVGASYAWEGQEIGSGTMTIKEIVPMKSVHSELVFLTPQSGTSQVFWYIEPQADGTKVTWMFQSEMGWPIERYFGLMMDGMLGPDFERGLANLKSMIESGS